MMHIHWHREVGTEARPLGSPVRIVLTRRRCRCGHETLRREPGTPPIPGRLADIIFPTERD